MRSRFDSDRGVWRPVFVLMLAGCLALAVELDASDRSATAAEASSGFFESDSVLEIGLEAPWRTLDRKRTTRPTAPGQMTSDAGGSVDVEIRLRGKWRLENCDAAPFSLSLSGDGMLVHLTPQCKRREKYRQYLVQEYLVYRLYEALTETSLRARLATVEYTDTETRKKGWNGQAILVEDIDAAADRLGRRWVDRESIRSAELDPDATALFALFQYMIGNTDWSLLRGEPGERCCHNSALLESEEPVGRLVPMPFDFDASGLVNTGDVEPSEFVPISSVRQRFYRGLCAHNREVEEAVGVMNRARPELEAILEGVDLAPGARRSTRRYLEEFFEVVNDPVKLEKRILARCRG